MGVHCVRCLFVMRNKPRILHSIRNPLFTSIQSPDVDVPHSRATKNINEYKHTRTQIAERKKNNKMFCCKFAKLEMSLTEMTPTTITKPCPIFDYTANRGIQMYTIEIDRERFVIDNVRKDNMFSTEYE